MRRIHILFISHLSVWRWRCFTLGRSLPFSTDKLLRAREMEMDLQGYLDAEQKDGQRDVLELLLLMDLMGTLVLCESNWKCLCIWRHLRNSAGSQLWLRGAQGGLIHLGGHSRTPRGTFHGPWGGPSVFTHLSETVFGTWGDLGDPGSRAGPVQQGQDSPRGASFLRAVAPGPWGVLAWRCGSGTVGCPCSGMWLGGTPVTKNSTGFSVFSPKSVLPRGRHGPTAASELCIIPVTVFQDFDNAE